MLWGLYFTVALGFVGAIIWGGVRGAMRESDLHPPADAPAEDPIVCAADLNKLYFVVHQEWDKTRDSGTPEADHERAAGWERVNTQLHALGARCHLEAAVPTEPMLKLTDAYRQVMALERLCAASSEKYRRDIAPTDIAARKALTAVGAPPVD